MYASRTLSSAERKYAQIEKQCLWILFACKRFDQYICGRSDSIVIETDHKPLLTIFNSDILKAPKRIQRMLLSLTRYNLAITYRKGKDMVIADLLSRYVDNGASSENNIHTDEVYTINEMFHEIEEINVLSEVNFNDTMLELIKEESAVKMLK